MYTDEGWCSIDDDDGCVGVCVCVYVTSAIYIFLYIVREEGWCS